MDAWFGRGTTSAMPRPSKPPGCGSRPLGFFRGGVPAHCPSPCRACGACGEGPPRRVSPTEPSRRGRRVNGGPSDPVQNAFGVRSGSKAEHATPQPRPPLYRRAGLRAGFRTPHAGSRNACGVAYGVRPEGGWRWLKRSLSVLRPSSPSSPPMCAVPHNAFSIAQPAGSSRNTEPAQNFNITSGAGLSHCICRPACPCDNSLPGTRPGTGKGDKCTHR